MVNIDRRVDQGSTQHKVVFCPTTNKGLVSITSRTPGMRAGSAMFGCLLVERVKRTTTSYLGVTKKCALVSVDGCVTVVVTKHLNQNLIKFGKHIF